MNWASTAALLVSGLLLIGAVADNKDNRGAGAMPDPATLRELYAGPPGNWPRPTLREGAVFTEFGPLPPVEHPADNPTSSEKVALGRRLFEDPQLSGSGQIACETCHHRELGFTDGLSRSFGHDRQRGRRNTQSLLTAAWMKHMFWDGRASSLEQQALMPITDPTEMAGDLTVVEDRLNRSPEYRQAFAQLFGTSQVRRQEIAKALAAFIRSVRPRSVWDKVMDEGTRHLNDSQLQGLHLFRTKAGCANCHNGPLFTDQRFHNEGMSFYGRANQDLGRYEISGKPVDSGAFRTPSLRGISRTAPYMHMGAFARLEPVLRFYNMGGAQPKRGPDQIDDPLFPTTSPLLVPLSLSEEELQNLKAFLETL